MDSRLTAKHPTQLEQLYWIYDCSVSPGCVGIIRSRRAAMKTAPVEGINKASTQPSHCQLQIWSCFGPCLSLLLFLLCFACYCLLCSPAIEWTTRSSWLARSTASHSRLDWPRLLYLVNTQPIYCCIRYCDEQSQAGVRSPVRISTRWSRCIFKEPCISTTVLLSHTSELHRTCYWNRQLLACWPQHGHAHPADPATRQECPVRRRQRRGQQQHCSIWHARGRSRHRRWGAHAATAREEPSQRSVRPSRRSTHGQQGRLVHPSIHEWWKGGLVIHFCTLHELIRYSRASSMNKLTRQVCPRTSSSSSMLRLHCWLLRSASTRYGIQRRLCEGASSLHYPHYHYTNVSCVSLASMRSVPFKLTFWQTRVKLILIEILQYPPRSTLANSHHTI